MAWLFLKLRLIGPAGHKPTRAPMQKPARASAGAYRSGSAWTSRVDCIPQSPSIAARATMAGLQRLQINLARSKWFGKQSSRMQTFLSIRRNEYAGRDDILGAIHLIERQYLDILSTGEDTHLITFGANRQLQSSDHLSLCQKTFRLHSEDLKCPQN